MNDVRINGVRYAPISSKPNSNQVNRLQRLLDSEMSFVVESKRTRVIKMFESGEEPKSESKPKIKNPQKSKSQSFNYNNFKGFDNKGHILLKRGCRKATSWSIHQVIDIKQWIDFGRKDKASVKHISDKVGLSEALVGQIIYNLENEELPSWIDKWIAQNNIPKKSVPVENNPQKRKDLGWF